MELSKKSYESVQDLLQAVYLNGRYCTFVLPFFIDDSGTEFHVD